MDDYEHLEVTLADDVLTIAFDRPDRLNAVNDPLHAELASVFADAYDVEDARVVVLTRCERKPTPSGVGASGHSRSTIHRPVAGR